jgi:outer membrane murein-binding lipoprotein Lpp
MRPALVGAAALGGLLLAGCAALLPHSRADDLSPFASYEAAAQALQRVEPYRTRLADLKALGFDVQAGVNSREMAYPQWVGALVDASQLSMREPDPGIRDCLAAREHCRGYQFRYGRVTRERQGSFLLDFLNFRRVTHTTGWRFEGMVLVRDDGLVLFRNHAGAPHIDATEVKRNPLGPLQSIGEAVPR